jgi:hypothetical protein
VAAVVAFSAADSLEAAARACASQPMLLLLLLLFKPDWCHHWCQVGCCSSSYSYC